MSEGLLEATHYGDGPDSSWCGVFLVVPGVKTFELGFNVSGSWNIPGIREVHVGEPLRDTPHGILHGLSDDGPSLMRVGPSSESLGEDDEAVDGMDSGCSSEKSVMAEEVAVFVPDPGISRPVSVGLKVGLWPGLFESHAGVQRAIHPCVQAKHTPLLRLWISRVSGGAVSRRGPNAGNNHPPCCWLLL